MSIIENVILKMKPLSKSQSMGEINISPSSPMLSSQSKLPEIAQINGDKNISKVPSMPAFGQAQMQAMANQYKGMGQFNMQNGAQPAEEMKLANKFQELLEKKKLLQSELAKQKQLKANNAVKDQLYSQVKDAIEKEIEEQQIEKKVKREEDEVLENKGIMEMINKQQQVLTDLIRQTRVVNENKLAYENQQLTERLRMLEEAVKNRKMMIEAEAQKPRKIKKKHKKKHKEYSNYPAQMYGYGNPYGPYPGGYNPYIGNMNYPLYYGAGMYPGYSQESNNGISTLAGAGLNSLNISPPNYYSEAESFPRKISKNGTKVYVPPSFEDKNKIKDGRDITDDKKAQLKQLLSLQLGDMNKQGQRLRPPSES